MRRIFTMKQALCLIMTLCLLTMSSYSCVTQKKQKKSKATTTYRTSTDFHLLQQGMSKQQFRTWARLDDGNHYVGKQPAKSHSYRKGDDIWEVWVFEVYKFREERRRKPSSYYGGVRVQGYYYTVKVPYVAHREYVAFKNGTLHEWGPGEGRRHYR